MTHISINIDSNKHKDLIQSFYEAMINVDHERMQVRLGERYNRAYGMVVGIGHPINDGIVTLDIKIHMPEYQELVWGGIFPATAHLAGKVERLYSPAYVPDKYVDLGEVMV